MLLELASPERRVTFMIAEGISSCVDARLMRIVLENLIINAWKFSSGKDEAVIEFGISEQKGEPAYFVRDNGVGFDMAHADKLFVAFRRLNKEAAFAGQGIGLATVQRIISRHGGRVWAESEQGKGATFYFTLPHTGQITESMIQTLSMPVESNP
jgi:light-regulated signal transduction histidine kinase (bacteriophytochrome)